MRDLNILVKAMKPKKLWFDTKEFIEDEESKDQAAFKVKELDVRITSLSYLTRFFNPTDTLHTDIGD